MNQFDESRAALPFDYHVALQGLNGFWEHFAILLAVYQTPVISKTDIQDEEDALCRIPSASVSTVDLDAIQRYFHVGGPAP
jgi:hypothetical protein